MKKITSFPIIVYSTFSSKVEATSMIQSLLKLKLIACANCIHSTSLYSWNRKIKEADEFVVIMKTFSHQYKKIEMVIKESHLYQCPCIFSISLSDILYEYATWMKEVVE